MTATIVDVELALLRVPLRTPFKTALRTVEAVEDVVVLLRTDAGLVGHGEAPPTPPITGETHESIVAAITNTIGPAVTGLDATDVARVSETIEGAIPGNSSAKAAVDIAVHDLWAQSLGLPLYRAMGGGTPRLETDLTISVNPVDQMVADTLDALDRGYTAIKVKVGSDRRQDVERLHAIHAAVAGRAALRLDANQGWSSTEAIEVVGTLEAAGVVLDLVEQPVPAEDLAGLRQVTDAVATPVLADEAVLGPESAEHVIRTRAADLVNIKLMKTGGVRRAIEVADLAAEHGVECMIGCMLESSISVAAAAHVAVARADTITRVDLDGPALCTEEPVRGSAVFDGPRIELGDGPGLGIRAIAGLRPLG